MGFRSEMLLFYCYLISNNFLFSYNFLLVHHKLDQTFNRNHFHFYLIWIIHQSSNPAPSFITTFTTLPTPSSTRDISIGSHLWSSSPSVPRLKCTRRDEHKSTLDHTSVPLRSERDKRGMGLVPHLNAHGTTAL